MSEQSGFRFKSFGIVVENKPRGTDFILVSPMEELYIQDSGSIRDKTTDFSGNKKSTNAVNFKSEHESKNFVRAKWKDISGGNRTSAPDVRAGESVLLIKYGNVDEYFWCTIGREPELRRSEDVLYSWSNLPSGQAAYDKDTSYWMRVNAVDKYVHIHTPNNDGELTTFDIKIDTKQGILQIYDGMSDMIEIKSREGNISLFARSEIIRHAPKITDTCQIYTVNSESYVNNTNSIINNSPIVLNNGDVATSGSDTANKNLNASCTCPNCI